MSDKQALKKQIRKDSKATLKQQSSEERENPFSEPMGEAFTKDWWKDLLSEDDDYKGEWWTDMTASAQQAYITKYEKSKKKVKKVNP